MIIERPTYMKQLIAVSATDQVKVITGIRRCGKSYLLFNLFKQYLLEQEVPGSNAKLLSHDVVTEFRRRGQEIAMMPLSFSEFMSAYAKDKREGYIEYATYGGLPGVLQRETPEEKTAYLNSLYDELYIRDIVERNGIRNQGSVEELIDVLSSGIGSLTNASKLSATFKSAKSAQLAPETIERYIAALEDAFLIRRAKRYNVKGRKRKIPACSAGNRFRLQQGKQTLLRSVGLCGAHTGKAGTRAAIAPSH